MFLENLFRFCNKGFVNLRFLPSGRDFFIPLRKIDSVPGILESCPGEDPYFSVCSRESGGDLIQLPALWVELGEESLRYKNFRLKPSFVITSNESACFYWVLRVPAPKEKVPIVENLLKRLAFYFEGDLEAAAVDAVLRLPDPGTLKECNPNLTYVLDAFKSHLPPLPVIETPVQVEKPFFLDTREAVLNEVVSLLKEKGPVLSVCDFLSEIGEKVGKNKLRRVLKGANGHELISQRVARGKFVYAINPLIRQ